MAIYLKKDLPLKKELSNIEFISKIDLNQPHVKVGILNLMPTLNDTEKDLLQALDIPFLQVQIDFLYLKLTSNSNINTYFKTYYTNYQSILHENYDGLLITGAPLEHLNYIDVPYIKELKELLAYTKKHVKSVLFLCWAAEFGLYYFYGVNRFKRLKKASGIYEHYLLANSNLTRNFSDYFMVPISRYCDILESDVLKIPELKIISKSNMSGLFIIEDDKRHLFLTGHLEYATDTLAKEYNRDIKKGLNTSLPQNYYFQNNYLNKPVNSWQAHQYLLFSNWLYYYCYK